ncbi:hypothetical protein [Paractinoplanes brasiliensis]|nr:hypothetical protein [Actinoplanes brasiliensis]
MGDRSPRCRRRLRYDNSIAVAVAVSQSSHNPGGGSTFLALRELRFARRRFTLIGSVVALVAVLVVILSGLSSGLVNDGVSGLQRLPVTAFAFDAGTKLD